MLGWVGSRCWIRIKAMPVPLGSAPSNLRKASRPPAEAPSPTTGKLSGASDESDLGEDCRLGPERAAPARCGPCPGTAMDPRRSWLIALSQACPYLAATLPWKPDPR